MGANFFAFVGLLFIGNAVLIDAQTIATELVQKAKWCTISDQEYAKCAALAAQVSQLSYNDTYDLDCIRGVDVFTCMSLINSNLADLITLESGLGYVAGEEYMLKPLLAEAYGSPQNTNYFAVIAVDAGSAVTLNNLQGKKLCSTGIGRTEGWSFPMSSLIWNNIVPVTQCNSQVQSVGAFFGSSCLPNAFTQTYNLFGDNPNSVCSLCVGSGQSFCSSSDPYANNYGAMTCLFLSGDLAFVRDSGVAEFVAKAPSLSIMSTTSQTSGGGLSTTSLNFTTMPQLSDFELLCPDGSRAPSTSAATCNWGTAPSHTVMTSALRTTDQQATYLRLLNYLQRDFGPQNTVANRVALFKSLPFGGSDLMFSDATTSLVDVGTKNTYYLWIGDSYVTTTLVQLNMCPIPDVRWCVISTDELNKCSQMRLAFLVKGLMPNVNCILSSSTFECLWKIQQGFADLISIDSGDLYAAGNTYGLVPIASEYYGDSSSYYAVAIARKPDKNLTINNMRYRQSCHNAIGTATGWIIPVNLLLETSQILVRGCQLINAVGELFARSCMPGALDSTFNPRLFNPINLCEACASRGPSMCARSNLELYYGDTGAFRCLVENGGEVAFARHTTVFDNTGGRNPNYWARIRRADDYELLCRDGTRVNTDMWASCNLGQVPGRVVVTASYNTLAQRRTMYQLLQYGQDYYASDSNTVFQMFDSGFQFNDLMFQDSTEQLVWIDPSLQNWRSWLGPNMLRWINNLQLYACGMESGVASAAVRHPPAASVLTLTALAFVLITFMRSIFF